MTLTPVTIFGGYLGSGKTTIILNALKQYPEPVKFAMIKNEYGDVNVDAQLIKNANVAVREVVNGCLCCVLVGELNRGIDELLNTAKPERIIIEASGNALPFPIVLELKKNPRVYLDGVVIVVDCLNFEKIKDKSVVAREQAKYTDLIVFNKAGLVDENQLYRVKEEVNDLNPDTIKIETTDGVIKPEILFGLDHNVQQWENLPVNHRHDEEMNSFGWQTEKSLDQGKVAEVLKACRPGSFHRIKGIIKTPEGWQLVNSVFGRINWTPLADDSGPVSRLIFIGPKIGQWEEEVKQFLEKAVI